MEHGISDSLLELLTRQDMRSKAVGAAELHGMKVPGAAIEARTGEVAGDREGSRQGPKCVWTNTSMTKRARSTAHLAIVA